MPQKFLAILCRAGSAHPAEHPCKVLLRFEAAGHRDIKESLNGADCFTFEESGVGSEAERF
jgi:hypothetical protein